MNLEDLATVYLESHHGVWGTRFNEWVALSQFLAHLPWEVQEIQQLNERHLTTYRAWLSVQPVEPYSVYSRYLRVRVFLRWAFREGHLLLPLGQDHDEKRPPNRWISRYSQEQMKILLEQPPQTLQGRADAFALELLYGTGLRRQEASRLRLTDLTDVGVWIRLGKGGKDRLVPTGPFLRGQIAQYLDKIRPQLSPNSEQSHLLLSLDGERLKMPSLAYRFGVYARQAGLPVRGLHSLRYAYATHLLEGGARMEDVQRLLGHASIRTTQIYTQVTPLELIRAVRKAHPRRRTARAR